MSRLRRYNYLLSVLPGLENLGSIAIAPMGKQELLERMTPASSLAKSVEVLLLSDDLMQREAFLAEEITDDQTDLAVLSIKSGETAIKLPDYLMADDSAGTQITAQAVTDGLWSRYFYHAQHVAKQENSQFLLDWIGFEVGLRNALCYARAQALDLNVDTYCVAADLVNNNFDYNPILAAWSSASDPLAALEVLDRARWDWLDEHSSWYSFCADEIEAYAAKLILLHRWRSLASN